MMLLTVSSMSYAQITVFSDNFENGTTNWTLTNSWGLSTAHYHSSSHALSESPVGNYTDNQTSYATMASGVNMATALSATVSFWSIYNIEGGFDYMYLQVSANGGNTWNTIHSFDDTLSVWTNFSFSLGGYVGNSNVKVRFKFVSDGYVNYDGMYIDDFKIITTDVDVSPPLVIHTPRDFYEGRLFTDSIVADIIDISGVAKAELRYSVDGGLYDTLLASSISGNTYIFVIPTVQAGASVKYYFYAKDSSIAANSISTSINRYIAGQHLFYNPGQVDFVDSIGIAAGAAMRMTLSGPTTIAAVLIRNYTDPNRLNDSILVHVWTSSLGLPGVDKITPVKIFPAATQQNTSPMTYVDLRAYSAQLSNLTGDVFIGYTVPVGGAWTTITQPSTVARSFKKSSSGWAAYSGSDYHFRVVTTGIAQLPIANFSYNASADPLVSFTNTSSNSLTYRWNFGDGSPFITTQNTTHTFANNGVFNVCLKATNATGSDSVCNNVTIGTYPVPVSDFTFNIAGDPTVNFTDGSSNSPTIWYWDFNDNGATSNTQNPAHTFPAVGGTYNVCLTASSINGNGNVICKNVVLAVGAGFDENGNAINIKIYPNPMSDNAIIEMLNKNTGAVSLKLFDMAGREISINYRINNKGIEIERNNVDAGTYIFRIIDDSKAVYTGTLIVK